MREMVDSMELAGAALREVLDAGRAAETALEPLDIVTFEAAVASRGNALRRLEEALARLGAGSGPGGPGNPVRDLAEAAAVQDRALGRRAAEALEGLRAELRGVQAGSQTLRGYRPAGAPPPRFADRRG